MTEPSKTEIVQILFCLMIKVIGYNFIEVQIEKVKTKSKICLILKRGHGAKKNIY